MAKKKSKAKKNGTVSEIDPEVDSNESSSFAEKLLSSMGIDSQPENEVNVVEEAVEDDEDDEDDFETRHPHMHSIHKTFSKVFRRESSRSDSQSSSSTSTPSTSKQLVASDPDSRQQADAEYLQTETDGEQLKNSTTDESAPSPSKKKRNRRKEKLAERERERIKLVQEAQEEASTDPDKRAIELKGMGMAITKAGLVEHEVQPDGHCLFHSLCDQLDQRRGVKLTVPELRSTLANFIREHSDDFVPYLVEDETGDVIDVVKYTSDLENTPLWGGDLEIMAASRHYNVPIRVYFASQPALNINEDAFVGVEPLKLAYYQAKFGLGAHYNSLREAASIQESS